MSQSSDNEYKKCFGKFYNKKRVFVTGHTGFKGSWLCTWLVEMGADVTGYSLEPPTEPAHFNELGLQKRMKDVRSDIRNANQVAREIAKARPEILFHLAAQPIVRASYDDPVTTYGTNVMGTVHVLEALRRQKGIRAAVIITSDKCYENVEQQKGYREGDRLGGQDPYSASKAGAEEAFSSYARSFFAEGELAVASARAGNVIGGGDWARDRLVPDCIRAWHQKQAPLVRNPSSIRPWQHVLEPISGYLDLAVALACGENRNARKSEAPALRYNLRGESFNLGPQANVNETVESLIRELGKHWPRAKKPKIKMTEAKPEAGLLRLDCAKARKRLGWFATLDFKETAAFTADWYRRFLENGEGAWNLTTSQICEYVKYAQARKLSWAK
jgi:CDP-glucose 4,6-dehydratase